MGLLEAPKGFGSHEFTPFATALSYATAPSGLWTASARPGGLNSQPECVTYDFSGLEAKRQGLNPVLDSSGVSYEIVYVERRISKKES